MRIMRSVLFGAIFEFFIFGCWSLKNTRIIVPEAVRIDDDVTLTCQYDLESAQLYSIKWYRNDEEFYRFVPKEAPPAQQFNVQYVNVNLTASDSSRVTLTSVKRATSGQYKCEVSADAPLFHTEIETAALLVAEVPLDGPVLKIDVHKLAPGAHLRANCTTPGSHPPMNVTWSINDRPIRNGVDSYRASIDKSIYRFDSLPGLDTVRSTIHLKTAPDSFHNGKLTLRCTANLFDLYESSKEIDVLEDAPQLALVIDGSNDQRNHGFREGNSVVGAMGMLLLLVVLG
ncbi:unnamed protein product [Phyllotreta striolata]|uniref:Ig-like domain-containing protein n=1 Tax=Phyllotreta striolata TaxID=444603 RepID=A0A9N9TKK6_PHYSR|nr:unnamed protein product [Phyllotreta striolata]